MRYAALACAVLLLGAAQPAQAHTRPDVQTVAERLAATPGVLGAIAEMYVDGKRAGRGSAGSRLLDGRGGTIPAGARYRIGSQTKGMTATVALQLMKEGRLGLDDKLSAVLPVVAEKDLVERAEEITVRQLIRHTSGVPEWFRPGLVDVFDTTTYYRPADLMKVSRSQPRAQEPGERFSYSSANYTLLTMIIERITGRSLAAEFDRRLFRPLGMTGTYLPVRPPEGIKGPHGHGYTPGPDGTLHDMDRLNASWGHGAGGVISTARDMAAYRAAFIQGELLPAGLQKVITDPPEGVPAPPPPPCGGKLVQTNGGAAGFTSATISTLDGRRHVAVSTTLEAAQDLTVIKAIAQAGADLLCS
ncbi:serine hydrolase domain-containing protein [Nonomuraea typhae]|uniref:serine hydrolase domain-containing protein n=1 Tax=Nonomuraea typhae TaxID=2603600 RepID=UPI0012FA3EAB|nr:serine hydrolase domain-containing protein [Nonomuraea typhae]